MRFYGWKGLLIEANPRLIPEIEAGFSGLDRSIVSCAVSDKAGTARLTIGVNDDVSSLDHGAAAAWGETKGEVMVQTRRLPEILDEHRVPKEFGLLSLDVEGFDLIVMNDLIDNSEYRPQYVVIEASYSFQTKSLKDIALSRYVRATYDLVGQTEANLILRRSSFG